MNEFENAPAEMPEGVDTADERAKYELQQEKQQATVENLQNVAEPTVDGEMQARADLDAVLAQSITGKHLGTREVNRARETGLEFERINPGVAQAWATWAEQSADHMGFVMAKLAAGELPSGPPERYSELSSAPSRWAAQRELNALIAANPPGTPGYIQNQSRIQALYQYTYGDEPIVGRGLRTVR